MILDAIGEIHPSNLVHELFSGSYYGVGIENKVKFEYFRPAEGISPLSVLDDRFWDSLRGYIASEGILYHNQKKENQNWVLNPPLYEDGQFERLLELSFQQLEFARKIWEEEIQIVKDSSYRRLYSEGIDQYPIDAIAKQKGMEVTYLDRDNKFYGLLQEIKYVSDRQKEEWHRNREGIWLQRIDPNEDDCLIIAGGEHLLGRYGFDKILREKDIRLNVVKSFGEYDYQLYAILQEIKKIDEAAWEVHFDKLGPM